MFSLASDFRVARRVLTKSSGATALSILSIALGIGLTTAVFSLGDAMLLRPLPIDRPSELYSLDSRGDDGRILMYGWPDYLDMSAAAEGIEELVAYQRRGVIYRIAESLEALDAHVVGPNYFRVLGVPAAIGRATVEDAAGRPQVVLAHRFWKQLGGDPALVGKTLVLSRAAFHVAGVMPESFQGLERFGGPDVWISADAWFTAIGNSVERTSREGQFEMVARLKPGVSPARAAAVLDGAIRGPGKHKPAPAGTQGTWLQANFAPGWTRQLLFGGGLFTALIAVLFVACANVVQLRLAQAEMRRKELAMRLALGAGAWRLTRQLLVETGLIAAAGAGLGILLAQTLLEKMQELISVGNAHIVLGARLDYRVLAFTAAAVLLSVLFTGLAPSRYAARLDVSGIIKSDQGTTGARQSWSRKLLIAGQVAFSVMLFGLALLFGASLRNAAAIRPGIDPAKNILVLNVMTGRTADRYTWCAGAAERLAGLAGVRGATFARRLPLSDSGGGMTTRIEIPGRAPMAVHLNNVAGNYFHVMGTRVVAGRGIGPEDRAGGVPVMVVSQMLARQVFGTENPLGQWIMAGGRLRQIVGVAEDGPSNDLRETPGPFVFLPFAQAPPDDITLMVETTGEPAALERAARAELARYAPSSTVYQATTLRRQMKQALAWDSMFASLTSAMGLFGVLLTGAGLFGLLEYAVKRRTRELGLRVALGARPAEIRRMVLGESLHIAGIGIPAGLAMLAAAAWFVRTMVLGITPLNPWIYLLSAAAALLLTGMAAWIPAGRATSIDPMEALRAE